MSKFNKGSVLPIVAIVACMIGVSVGYTNCGAGFSGNSLDGLSSALGFGKLNVLSTEPDGSYGVTEVEYRKSNGEVIVNGLNVASTEILKPGDTYYQTTPANLESQRKQDFVVSSLSYESSQRNNIKVAQALKTNSTTGIWGTIRSGILANKVLYYDNNSHWIAQIRQYESRFNKELSLIHI